MPIDALLRTLVAGGAVAGLLLFVLGGLLTRISGRWRDGERRIRLSQFGPFVSGSSSVRGGEERYSGFACFGHVRLSRRAYGAEWLRTIGFADRSMKVVTGATMGRLRLRLRGATLVGTFHGRKFSFSQDHSRLLSTHWVTPVDRSWHRDGDSQGS